MGIESTLRTADEDAPSLAARPPRKHAITLCCAESVSSLVEEVVRSLSGLGFDTSLVTGSDARAALMDRRRTQTPTIYVVCVQGDLKDTVLGPLRQALATHAGPNEHLFVAVLDLSLPLTMVGQVRRFAEALERSPSEAHGDPLDERRQWREHSGNHSIDEADTRAYRTVSRPSSQANTRGTGAHPIVSPRKPPRISPTRKYRALTAPALPLDSQSHPSAPPKARTKTQPMNPEPDAPRTVRKQVKVPGLQTRTVTESGEFGGARFGAAIAGDANTDPKGLGWITVGLIALLVLVAGGATYFLGGFDRFLLPSMRADAANATVENTVDNKTSKNPAEADAEAHREDGSSSGEADEQDPSDGAAAAANDGNAASDETPAAPSDEESADEPENAESADESEDGEPQDGEPQDGEPQDGEPQDGEPQDGEPQDGEPQDGEPTEAQPANVEPDDEPADDEPKSPSADEPSDNKADLEAPATPSVEAALAKAIERRDVLVSNKYYVALPQPARAGWGASRKLCRDLDVDGIDDWRLPFRRELQLLGAIGMLTRGASFWSRTVDSDDNDYAFVYERRNRRLTSWEKSETADVVCVLKRN